MNKHLLPLLASAMLIASCSEKPGYEISGTVTNTELNGKYVYLSEYGKPDVQPFDSALVKNNAFTFKGTQNGAMLTTIQFAENAVSAKEGEQTPFKTTFTLENGKITIKLDSIPTVTGTPANDAEKTLKDQIKPLTDEIGKLKNDITSQNDTLVKAAEKKYDGINEKITDVVCNYIMGHTNQKMSAKYMIDYRYDLSEDQQNQILAKADSTFKSVPGIDKMIEHLDVLKTVSVGKKFTDFEMADANGQMHKLSEFVGTGKKVVLIDFWASWCPPCRREMPNLVNLYKQYKNKSFDIVGISLDSKADAWSNGVKTLNITWTQLSDLQGWKNAGAALYGVNSIPHTILVDKDGIIVAKNIFGEELNNKVAEILK